MSLSAPKPAGLSVFFPAYNDSGTIASMVVSALLAARALTPDHEVIVVNDGSADKTAEILDELAATYPQVRIVHHETNRGYGGALQTGFSSATKELVFYTDGDAQYDPAELAVLWRAMTPLVFDRSIFSKIDRRISRKSQSTSRTLRPNSTLTR